MNEVLTNNFRDERNEKIKNGFILLKSLCHLQSPDEDPEESELLADIADVVEGMERTFRHYLSGRS